MSGPWYHSRCAQVNTGDARQIVSRAAGMSLKPDSDSVVTDLLMCLCVLQLVELVTVEWYDVIDSLQASVVIGSDMTFMGQTLPRPRHKVLMQFVPDCPTVSSVSEI